MTLHCVPRIQMEVDVRGREHFRNVWLNIWDDHHYDDPRAIRRREDYGDINLAHARLEDISNDKTFDKDSRAKAAVAIDQLLTFKEST